MNRCNFIYDFAVSKEQMKKILESPGISEEYLEECRKAAELFKKPSKEVKR